MEEKEYKTTYRVVNERRCVFEKAVLAGVCGCEKLARFCLADREGVACKSPAGCSLCTQLLQHLRRNARFALRLKRVEGALPHAKEMKVQAGGLRGVRAAVAGLPVHEEKVDRVSGLIGEAVTQFHGLENLPYDEIVKIIATFEYRPRRHQRSKK